MPRRRHRLVRGTAATLVLLAVGGYVVLHHESGTASEPRCTVTAADGGRSYTLPPTRAANAATIEAVGAARELPERAVTIAVATAMQESGLRNLDYGDRDSLGLFQQRPSMGWGSPEQIMDPVYAADAFYERLIEVPDYQTLPLTEAAQRVQRSAYPDEYAKHEADAALLSAALTGRAAAALNCTTGNERLPGDPEEAGRLLVREFGEGVTPGIAGAELTIQVPAAERGWELAHWSVTHSVALGIERIALGGRVWEADRSDDGWREISTDGENAAETSDGELRLSFFVPE